MKKIANTFTDAVNTWSIIGTVDKLLKILKDKRSKNPNDSWHIDVEERENIEKSEN